MEISRAQLKAIKRMDLHTLESFLKRFYQEAFVEGLREAEKEFDDPEMYQIVDADVVRETIGNEQYEQLIQRGEMK